MLNDAICFEAVLHRLRIYGSPFGHGLAGGSGGGTDGEQALCAGHPLSFLRQACGPHQGPRVGRGRMAPAVQEAFGKPVPMAANSWRGTFPIATTVSLADGGTDGHSEAVCQGGGAARIYGMTLYKTEKFSGGFATVRVARIPTLMAARVRPEDGLAAANTHGSPSGDAAKKLSEKGFYRPPKAWAL